MKRLILAVAVVSTLALSAPSQAPAAGPLRRVVARIFGRPPVQRNFSVQIGGGRGVQFSRQVVRAQPVVVQRQVVVQRNFGFGRRRGH